ncbi:MFS transporter [Streptomyces sp. NPDC087856]|uniref:MFS transporter n=1 Tax=Streptomyces sp. NPDC087856 TaxID=3365811 RepID=UPI00380D2A04
MTMPRQVSSPSAPDIESRTLRKMTLRLIPLLALLFFVNYLDRTNIGVAALTMNDDLGLSATAFGFAAGLFSIPYALLEIPSNLLLDRFGARIWLARIMVSWGIVLAATGFVNSPFTLYVARFMLGVTEAGFYPGVVLYMTRWFPLRYRATAMTLFGLGNPMALVLGGPISTAVVHMPTVLGRSDWQMLFLVEGIPAVLLGVYLFFRLPERPRDVAWLSEPEKNWLESELRAESEKRTAHTVHRVRDVFRNLPVVALTIAKFCVIFAQLGVTLWLPQIIKTMGHLSTIESGLVSGFPFLIGGVASVMVGRHSDRTGERTYHIAVPALVGCIGFVIAGLTGNLILGAIGITLGASGIWVCNTVAWVLPGRYLTGAALAAGIACINGLGNLGGFFGPYIVGWLKSATGGFHGALFVLGLALALDAVIIVLLGRAYQRDNPDTPVPAGPEPQHVEA